MPTSVDKAIVEKTSIQSNLKNKLVEYQLFPRQYFSGSDVYIIIGNTVIDEIKFIEVDLSQAVTFLYGYASYTADAVAYGARAVQGRFAINFKENGYLMSILNNTTKSIAQYASEKAVEPAKSYAADAQYIASLVKNGDYNKLKDAIQEQEDLIWGRQTSGAYDKYHMATLLPIDNYEDIKKNGFDIIISYGDEGFHIGDAIGELPSTVEVINGVHLMGCRKTIEPSGENILEEYTFIAKDFNNRLREAQEAAAPVKNTQPKEITTKSNITQGSKKTNITILSK